MKVILPNDMDKDCIALCKAINRLPGTATFESCCGHLMYPYRIWFRCKNFISLAILARAFDRRYLPSTVLWQITAETGDSNPSYGFCIESKEPYLNQEDLDKDLKSIIENIKYWNQKQFKPYFKNAANSYF